MTIRGGQIIRPSLETLLCGPIVHTHEEVIAALGGSLVAFFKGEALDEIGVLDGVGFCRHMAKVRRSFWMLVKLI